MNVIETHDARPPVRRHLGPAGVLARDPGRHADGSRRTERCRQVHAPQPGHGAEHAVGRRLSVLGGLEPGSPAALDGIGYVAQDVPVYRGFSVLDMISLTKNLNRTFDTAHARQRMVDLGIDLKKRAGDLSGGQRAQLALTLALARHPRLLVLDEPTAALDPLARHDFMATVMAAMADDGVSVVLSSHLLTELERVADHLVLLSRRPGPARRVRRRPARRAPARDHPVRPAPDGPRVGGRRAGGRRRPDPAARPAPLARGRAASWGRRPAGGDRGARDGLPPHRLTRSRPVLEGAVR